MFTSSPERVRSANALATVPAPCWCPAARNARTTCLRVCDFHALRRSFGVMSAKSGVALVFTQHLMQHSTPVLTANVYSDVGGELADEVAKLPPLGPNLGANLGATGFPVVPSGENKRGFEQERGKKKVHGK